MKPYDPRRFRLVRTEDVSGMSGTGVVAVGVAYKDGAVHLQWRNAENPTLETDSNGMATKPAPDGVAATAEIHGHGGRTRLWWIDPPHDTVCEEVLDVTYLPEDDVALSSDAHPEDE